MLTLLLLACGPADAPTTDSATAVETEPVVPSAYQGPEDDRPDAPTLTSVELAEGLQEAIDVVVQLDPLQLHEAWQRTMTEHADSDCPEIILHNGMDHWREDGCTTERGSLFRGWSLYYRQFMGRPLVSPPPEVFYLEVGWLSGQSVILTSDDIMLQSYGDVLYQHTLNEAGEEFRVGFLQGDFTWTNPDVEGTWLQEDVTMELDYNFGDHGDHNSAELTLQISQLLGPVPAQIWDQFSLRDESGSCGLEPTAHMRLRDRDGRWIDLVFEGTLAQGDACDGCGVATLDGQELGQVCADFSGLLDWSPSGRL